MRVLVYDLFYLDMEIVNGFTSSGLHISLPGISVFVDRICLN